MLQIFVTICFSCNTCPYILSFNEYICAQIQFCNKVGCTIYKLLIFFSYLVFVFFMTNTKDIYDETHSSVICRDISSELSSQRSHIHEESILSYATVIQPSQRMKFAKCGFVFVFVMTNTNDKYDETHSSVIC